MEAFNLEKAKAGQKFKFEAIGATSMHFSYVPEAIYPVWVMWYAGSGIDVLKCYTLSQAEANFKMIPEEKEYFINLYGPSIDGFYSTFKTEKECIKGKRNEAIACAKYTMVDDVVTKIEIIKNYKQ